MKLASLFLAASAVGASAQTSSYVNFVRQTQQGTSVVWDMPVAAAGSAASSLLLEKSGSLFQLWTIDQTKAKDYLLDQKLVGAYLPKADIKITTLDSGGTFPRTRVDQPFSVEISVSDLLSGIGMPAAATKVLLEQHIQAYAAGQTSIDPTLIAGSTPSASAYLTENGKTVLKFPASSLQASDPTKTSGEEHFIVHALSDGSLNQTQIASAKVQVWPVASGAIHGIAPGDQLRHSIPKLQIHLNDLYPLSDTYLMVYEGGNINGLEGKNAMPPFPVDRDRSVTEIREATELAAALGADGDYTIALFSDTIYGRELLCEPIPFSVKRTLSVNAMQVNFSNGTTP